LYYILNINIIYKLVVLYVNEKYYVGEYHDMDLANEVFYNPNFYTPF
jgi:hypothetical protein